MLLVSQFINKNGETHELIPYTGIIQMIILDTTEIMYL